MAKTGERPQVTDRHSSTLLAAGGVLAPAGGVFMTVTALEPAKIPRAVWASSWFDIGLACLITGLLFATLSLFLNYRRRKSITALPKKRTKPPTTTGKPRQSLPPLMVKIQLDSQFNRWENSLWIAILNVSMENTTSKDVLIDSFEFTYSNEGRLPWEHQVTDAEQASVVQEIERLYQAREHGQPLKGLTHIAAGNRLSCYHLAPVPRDPEGGTPECKIVIKDGMGNKYPARLPRQEPRTFDPVSG